LLHVVAYSATTYAKNRVNADSNRHLESVLRCCTGPLKRGHLDGFFVQLSRMGYGYRQPVLELRMGDAARTKGALMEA
jgi:hypothetical protein